MLPAAFVERYRMDRPWFKNYDPGVPHSADYPDTCLPLYLQDVVNRYPLNTAIEFYGAGITYSELWEQVLSFATYLQSIGVEHGSRVAIMLPNCPQTVIAFHAVLWIGGVVVMVNPMYVGREMELQWNDCQAEFLVTLDHLYPRVEKVLESTQIRKVIVTRIQDYMPNILKVLYPFKARWKKLFTAVPYNARVVNFTDSIKGAGSHAPCSCHVRSNDLAVLQYTGGTTGISKGVMLSHRNILANVVQLASWFPDLKRGEERFISILPFFHVFGLTVAMNLPLYTGSAMIIIPRLNVRELMRTVHQRKPSIFPGVPTIFLSMLNDSKRDSFNLSSIRVCITGSAPMPVDHLRSFEAITGSIVVEGYGLTESSPVTHCNPIYGLRKPGSIGIPIPDTDCKIMDLTTGNVSLPPGEAGEIVVRGPQVMQGYWGKKEETEQVLRDGWLYTGDIAWIDEEGYAFIVDRKKDVIISGGYNVYPREIDEILYQHPKVLDAAAVGIPDPYWGETVKAYIVPKAEDGLTAEEVILYCRESLAAYKVPKAVEFRNSLPKSTVGKVLRKELRKEVLGKGKE
jgi:long-chain acyl-CoA synthetase